MTFCHVHDFWGMKATGKCDVNGIRMLAKYRINNNKIVEHESSWDVRGMVLYLLPTVKEDFLRAKAFRLALVFAGREKFSNIRDSLSADMVSKQPLTPDIRGVDNVRKHIEEWRRAFNK
jgi:hypothetical protein